MKTKSEIQEEIVNSLPEIPHGLLNLAPRVGKTKIAIDIIKKCKPKRILWVTPSTKLRDIDIPKEFNTWKALRYYRKTDILCYASLEDHEGDYEMIILDEYQDCTINNMKNILNGKIKYKYIIGLSGTHPKHKEKLDIYKKLKLKILKEMSIDEAVDSNLIAPYKITAIGLNLDSKDKYIPAGNKAKPFMNTEEGQYRYLTRLITMKQYSGQQVPKFFYLNRMRFIHNLKSKFIFAEKLLKKLTGRTLIFCSSIEQAEKICKHTFHSKKDDSDYKLFQEGKIDKLALVNSGGVGHTYKNVDNLLIIQVNADSKGDSTQKIARSLVLQEGYEANIYILYINNTVDENWKDSVLENFKTGKIEHVSYKNYE